MSSPNSQSNYKAGDVIICECSARIGELHYGRIVEVRVTGRVRVQWLSPKHWETGEEDGTNFRVISREEITLMILAGEDHT